MRAILIQRHEIKVKETITKWEKEKLECKKKPIVFYDYPSESKVKLVREDKHKSSKNS